MAAERKTQTSRRAAQASAVGLAVSLAFGTGFLASSSKTAEAASTAYSEKSAMPVPAQWETLFTQGGYVKPNVMIFFNTGVETLEWAYPSYDPAVAGTYRDCTGRTGCNAACTGSDTSDATQYCPQFHLGTMDPSTVITLNAASCYKYNAGVANPYFAHLLHEDSRVLIAVNGGNCRISIDRDWNGAYEQIRDLPFRSYYGDEWNAATSTKGSALQGLLAKKYGLTRGVLDRYGLGPGVRAGYSRFNNRPTNSAPLGNFLLAHEGEGGCVEAYLESAPWNNPTDRMLSAFTQLTTAWPSWWRDARPHRLHPVAEALGDLMTYYKGWSRDFCYQGSDQPYAGFYPSGWGNGRNGLTMTPAADDTFDEAYLQAQSFVLFFALQPSSWDTSTLLAPKIGTASPACAASGDLDCDSQESNSFPYNGSHYFDDLALHMWREDYVVDRDIDYAAGQYPTTNNTKCSTIHASADSAGKALNCSRQSVATDVIHWTDEDYYRKAGQYGQGKSFKVDNMGYDCSHVVFPEKCWAASSVAAAVNHVFNTYWNRNVAIGRSFYISQPAISVDPYGGSGSIMVQQSFVPTPGVLYEGHLTAYPFPPTASNYLDSATQQSSGNVFSQGNILRSATAGTDFLWDAGRVLASTGAGTRTIYTDDPTSTSNLVTLSSLSTDTAFGAFNASGSISSPRVNSIKRRIAEGVYSAWMGGSLTASWKLGDGYVTPVVVGPPNPFFLDSGLGSDLQAATAYQNFFSFHQTRARSVYTMTNDGIVHSFNAGTYSSNAYTTGTGAERWAYVPEGTRLTMGNRNGYWNTGAQFGSFTTGGIFATFMGSMAFSSGTGIFSAGVFTGATGFVSSDAFVSGKQYNSNVWMRPPGLDGFLTAADVFIDGYPSGSRDGNKACTSAAACEFRTLLIGSTGRSGTPGWDTQTSISGRGIFALDITDPTTPVKWGTFRADQQQASSSNNVGAYLGYPTSKPLIGRVKLCNNDTSCANYGSTLLEVWIAAFGAGYHPASDPTNPACPTSPNFYHLPCYKTDTVMGRGIYVLDLRTMTSVYNRYYLDGKPGGTDMKFAFAAPPAGIDSNGDGFWDALYFPDLGGQLWKLDVAGIAGVSNTIGSASAQVKTCTGADKTYCWTWGKLFEGPIPGGIGSPTAGPTTNWHPIWVQPAVTRTADGTILVAIGSGDKNRILDISTATTGRIWVVADRQGSTISTLTQASLVDRTTPSSGAAPNGWYMQLSTQNGQKVLTRPVFSRGHLIAFSFIPHDDPNVGIAMSTDPALQKALFHTRWNVGTSMVHFAKMLNGDDPDFSNTQFGSGSRDFAAGRGVITGVTTAPVLVAPGAAGQPPTYQTKLIVQTDQGHTLVIDDPATSTTSNPLANATKEPQGYVRMLQFKPVGY